MVFYKKWNKFQLYFMTIVRWQSTPLYIFNFIITRIQNCFDKKSSVYINSYNCPVYRFLYYSYTNSTNYSHITHSLFFVNQRSFIKVYTLFVTPLCSWFYVCAFGTDSFCAFFHWTKYVLNHYYFTFAFTLWLQKITKLINSDKKLYQKLGIYIYK